MEYFGVGEIGETDGKMGKYGDTIKNPADFVENMSFIGETLEVLLAFVHGRVQYHFGVLVTPVCAVIHTVASCKFTQRSQITRSFKAKSW